MKKSFNEEQIRDKTDFVRTLSYNMQIMRKKLGFTQLYMAEQIGVSVNYISNVERGKTEITAYIVQKYCDLLGLTPNQIYNEDTNRIKISDSLNDNILKLNKKEIYIAGETVKTLLKSRNYNKTTRE